MSRSSPMGFAAYADLFKLNNKADEKDTAWVKNKLKTLTQGSKGDAVLNKMAATFTALSKEADFTAPAIAEKEDAVATKPTEEDSPSKTEDAESERSARHREPIGLSYNINIELPAVRDQLVYDAIFKALRDNLL
jgi:hypothetical protein